MGEALDGAGEGCLLAGLAAGVAPVLAIACPVAAAGAGDGRALGRFMGGGCNAKTEILHSFTRYCSEVYTA